MDGKGGEAEQAEVEILIHPEGRLSKSHLQSSMNFHRTFSSVPRLLAFPVFSPGFPRLLSLRSRLLSFRVAFSPRPRCISPFRCRFRFWSLPVRLATRKCFSLYTESFEGILMSLFISRICPPAFAVISLRRSALLLDTTPSLQNVRHGLLRFDLLSYN
jgi:hypothetical protein